MRPSDSLRSTGRTWSKSGDLAVLSEAKSCREEAAAAPAKYQDRARTVGALAAGRVLLGEQLGTRIRQVGGCFLPSLPASPYRYCKFNLTFTRVGNLKFEVERQTTQ